MLATCPYVCCALLALSVFSVGYVQTAPLNLLDPADTLLDTTRWQAATDRYVVIYTASEADRRYLLDIFEIIADARDDLQTWQLELPASHLIIHPDLASYQTATGQAWYVAAIADRAELRIDMQRARVLSERGSLQLTLRHELFHVAQPEGLARYLAEGLAMHFSGEQPQARVWQGPLAQLERILAAPRSQQELNQAMARAYAEVANDLQRVPVTCLLFADDTCP